MKNDFEFFFLVTKEKLLIQSNYIVVVTVRMDGIETPRRRHEMLLHIWRIGCESIVWYGLMEEMHDVRGVL